MAVPGSERTRLDSWKEIAEYLGRDVRTVVRWEKEKGLPIHTVPGLRRRSVFAYKDELDNWLAGSPHVNGELDGPLAEADEAPHGKSRHDELTGEEARGWKRSFQHGPVTRNLLTLAVCSIAIFLLLAYVVSTVRTNIAASSAVDKVTLQENKIVAWNKNGGRNWQYEVPPSSGRFYSATLASNIGENAGEECLVCLFRKIDNPEMYLLFSSAGRLLWNYSPQDVLKFGTESYSPPWALRGLQHITIHGEKVVALAFTHNTWWPSIVVLLDEQGRPIRKFANAGWITSLISIDGPKGPLLVAGGANNAHNGAMIAILDPEQLAGSSPEEQSSRFECMNCGPGRPLKYFVFPRSELNIATGSTFNFASIVFQGDRLIVQTKEEEGEAREPRATAFYEISPELKLLRASFGDRYWDLHRKLEIQGTITHAKAQCPDRNGPRGVLSWDAQDAWKELHPN